MIGAGGGHLTNTHEGQDSIPREMERDGEKKETEFSNTKLNYKEKKDLAIIEPIM